MSNELLPEYSYNSCIHNFIVGTDGSFVCRYCGYHLGPSITIQDAQYELQYTPDQQETKKNIMDMLREVQKWLSGEQSKEKLAEKLGLNFWELCDILPSDSVPELYERWLQCNKEC